MLCQNGKAKNMFSVKLHARIAFDYQIYANCVCVCVGGAYVLFVCLFVRLFYSQIKHRKTHNKMIFQPAHAEDISGVYLLHQLFESSLFLTYEY